MGKVNPIDFSFHIKKGDTDLPLRMQLFDSDTCTEFDISGYSIRFYMAPIDDLSTPKVNGSSANIVSAADGIFEYIWGANDTDTEGKFQFIFKLTKSGKTFSVPLVSPGIVVVEPTIG